MLLTLFQYFLYILAVLFVVNGKKPSFSLERVTKQSIIIAVVTLVMRKLYEWCILGKLKKKIVKVENFSHTNTMGAPVSGETGAGGVPLTLAGTPTGSYAAFLPLEQDEANRDPFPGMAPAHKQAIGSSSTMTTNSANPMVANKQAVDTALYNMTTKNNLESKPYQNFNKSKYNNVPGYTFVDPNAWRVPAQQPPICKTSQECQACPSLLPTSMGQEFLPYSFVGTTETDPAKVIPEFLPPTATTTIRPPEKPSLIQSHSMPTSGTMSQSSAPSTQTLPPTGIEFPPITTTQGPLDETNFPEISTTSNPSPIP